MMASKHNDFKISNTALFIDYTNPFLGASPDGMVECMRGDQCQNNPHYEIVYLVHYITRLQINY